VWCASRVGGELLDGEVNSRSSAVSAVTATGTFRFWDSTQEKGR
jgi:hypothetical protein